jgi:phasin family protein
MANQFVEQTSEKYSDALNKGAETAKKLFSDSSSTLAESSKSSAAAVQELAKAYQELAARNVKNLTAAMEALVAVKSPTDYLALQQKLIKDGVEQAVSDGRHIAELTTALFSAAFEPVKRQIESAQKKTNF